MSLAPSIGVGCGADQNDSHRIRENGMISKAMRVLAGVACVVAHGAACAQEPPPAVNPRNQVVRPAAQAAQPNAAISARAVVPRNATERAEVSAVIARGNCLPTAYVARATSMLDTTPMERPMPLAVIQGNRDAVLGRISTLLRQRGFAETLRNIDAGELRASRADRSTQGARDDVLVWADGQAGDATRIRLYFQYGRYEPFFGHPEPQRMQVTPDEWRKNIGAVRQAIIDLAGAP
jgi:hypothetical protein